MTISFLERLLFEVFYFLHFAQRVLSVPPANWRNALQRFNEPPTVLERQLEKSELLRWRFPDEAEKRVGGLEDKARLCSDCTESWRAAFLDRLRVERIKIGDRRRWLAGEHKR